jgi:hypothetical protein
MLSRRELLAAAAGALGAGVLAGCTRVRTTSPSAAASSTPTATAATALLTRHSYGPDPSQFGDLYLPTGTAKKV